MGKLTLSVDADVVRAAKRYAARTGGSVSAMVEDYLARVTQAAGGEAEALPPVLRKLRAGLRGVHRRDYRRYLERKYR